MRKILIKTKDPEEATLLIQEATALEWEIIEEKQYGWAQLQSGSIRRG